MEKRDAREGRENVGGREEGGGDVGERMDLKTANEVSMGSRNNTSWHASFFTSQREQGSCT